MTQRLAQAMVVPLQRVGDVLAQGQLRLYLTNTLFQILNPLLQEFTLFSPRLCITLFKFGALNLLDEVGVGTLGLLCELSALNGLGEHLLVGLLGGLLVNDRLRELRLVGLLTDLQAALGRFDEDEMFRRLSEVRALD